MLIIRAKYHSLLTICAATTVFISADSFSTPLPKLQVLHAFNEQNNNTLASIPRSLTQGKDGSLFGVIRGSDSGPSSKVFKINLNQNPPKYTDYFNFAAFDDFNNLDNEFVAATHLTLARNGSIYVSGLGRGFVAGPESLYKITSLNPAQSSIISSFPTWMSDATGSHKLLEVNGGKFYSTTAGGGNFIASQPYLTSAGTIFETDTNNSDSFTNTKILHIFDGYNGATPAGGLIKIKNSLYGTTCQNAINNNGTVAVKQNGIIYRYDLKASGNKYVVLHRFNGSNGACPQGELLKAKNGKLYGTTSAGGKVGEGVIFELDINRPKPIYRVVHNFDGIQGGHPRQTLVQSSKGGSIYGVTFDGGNPDKGVVFKFDVTRLMTKYSVIHEFDDWASGKNPGNILYGKDCNLYGVANGGPYKGGLVYRIKLNAGNNRCR